MANEYLVKIHNFLSEKIRESEKELIRYGADNADTTRRYYQGRLNEFKLIRQYLSIHFDLDTQVYY